MKAKVFFRKVFRSAQKLNYCYDDESGVLGGWLGWG